MRDGQMTVDDVLREMERMRVSPGAHEGLDRARRRGARAAGEAFAAGAPAPPLAEPADVVRDE